jgi:hypothetical protein
VNYQKQDPKIKKIYNLFIYINPETIFPQFRPKIIIETIFLNKIKHKLPKHDFTHLPSSAAAGSVTPKNKVKLSFARQVTRRAPPLYSYTQHRRSPKTRLKGNKELPAAMPNSIASKVGTSNGKKNKQISRA